MARPEIIRNTYEGTPDEWKELIQIERGQQGRVPEKEYSRQDLLHYHDGHLKFLMDGVMPPRTFILPSPYAPSKTCISQATQIDIKELKIGARNPDTFIILRTITEPYVYSCSVTIVEDETGVAARLMVCNLEDTAVDPIIVRNSILAIKQPCWSRAIEDGYLIRVDHPSDLMCIGLDDELVPRKWKEEASPEIMEDCTKFKKEGDLMFLKKKFRKARQLYDRALSSCQAQPDIVAQIDLYRKRCGVNLVLLRFDHAAKDLSNAISLFLKSDNKLAEQGIEASEIELWLHNNSVNDPLKITLCLSRPLKDLATRVKFDIGIYQSAPNYDFQTISTSVGPLSLHVDAANYIEDTKIKMTEHHGRGLFAKKPFKAGDLIIAEKAFALPGYFFNDRGSNCSLYSLGDGTATDRAGALLYKELVQKLRHSPSLRRIFFDMDDGGYWSENGWTIEEGHEIPVDVFRIDYIRRRNCFSAPLRSLDLLTNPAPVRHGFWIHCSYVNHDCLPNSVRTFIGDILLLRATRDIAEGEEITSQYLSPELKLEERQEKFMGTWGFTCDCSLCQFDGSLDRELEEKRLAIFDELKSFAQKLGDKPSVTGLKKFAKRIRDLEALYSDEMTAEIPCLCLVHPTLFVTEAWRTLKNMDRMIESAHKLLKYFGIIARVQSCEFEVLKNSGLVNVETVRALKYLAEGYGSKGNEVLADQIDVIARVWFRTITGADIGVHEFFNS